MLRRSFVTHVSLAHRYHNPRWDESQNRRVYGDEHNLDGLGANMRVWLEIEGTAAEGDLLVPEGAFAPHSLYVKELLDHRCLFDAEPWFTNRVSTLENIALFLREKFSSRAAPAGRWHALSVESAGWTARVLFSGQDARLRLTHHYSRDEWTVEATVAAPVEAESGLAAIRAEVAAVLLSTPFGKPDVYFQNLKHRLPELAAVRCQKRREIAYEFVAF